MCGILGTIPTTENHLFKNALDTLTHRGPDDFGIENISNDITLGHRRLSIVDLSRNGHQPMSDSTARYTLIFNGEIYNFVELREDLIKHGYTFVSKSDSEVALYSYIEWGEKCVDRFNGMWALAIWDNVKKELFMSRDRFGKKPLFYAFVKGTFVFASEMKAIYPFLDEVKPSPDFHWMKNNIFLYESSEKCLIDGIKRFPFGHNGVYKNGKLTIYRYWNTLDNLVPTPPSYDEQVNVFRELFVDACRIRMRSDVPIGTALSGGLDSSATISVMAHIARNESSYSTKDWQHAFVASFPGTPLDESVYAKMVVDNIGIGAEYININPLEHWNKLDDYFYKFEELYITSPIPMLMTYEAVKKHGTTVTLDGHGADELLSGYGHILEALWDAKLNIGKIKDILDTHYESVGNFSQNNSKGHFELYSRFIVKKLLNMVASNELKSKDSLHENYRKLDNFSQSLYIIFHETILPTLLRNYDRYSMINSVEIRMPFMDHRIVSFVNSLPYTSKFGGGYTKKLIRDAVAPYMPEEITWRKSKIGFTSPILDWMQNDLRDWFGDTVHSKEFMESSLITDSENIRNDVLNIINKNDNSFNHAQKVWTDITPFLWGKSILGRNYR
jgi:asparagine synthase (glutamine-hydrolysing)